MRWTVAELVMGAEADHHGPAAGRSDDTPVSMSGLGGLFSPPSPAPSPPPAPRIRPRPTAAAAAAAKASAFATGLESEKSYEDSVALSWDLVHPDRTR